MTRKEIYDSLEQKHMKVAFTLGAMLYDDATDRGAKPLTAEAVEGMTDNELSALNVFVLELIAAEPGALPEELEAAFEAVGAVLKRCSIVRNCVANAAIEGLICDEDDKAAMQRILSGETTLEDELDAVIEQYRAPKLRPSHHGEDCPGNGEHPGIECQCDECDHYLECFPEFENREPRQKEGATTEGIAISDLTMEELEEFLCILLCELDGPETAARFREECDKDRAVWEKNLEKEIEEICAGAWADFLNAVREGRGAEWFELPSEGAECQHYFLRQFKKMLAELDAQEAEYGQGVVKYSHSH